jgi:malonyl CoA-acyl carrier protein transacylase
MKRISLNKVMAKLAEEKTELGQHKVELGLIEDMVSQSKQADKLFTQAMKSTGDRVAQSIRELNVAGKALVKVRPIGHRIEEASKELGVPVPKEVANLQSFVDQSIREVDAMLKELNRLR